MRAIFTFTLIAIHSLHVAANSGRSPDSNLGKRIIKTPGINYILTNPGATAQELKDRILGSADETFEGGTQLQWPPLPRSWIEYATTDFKSSNTLLGFKANPAAFAFGSSVASRLNFEYRYQVKSSFVAIANRDVKTQNSAQLFRFDDKNMKTYLNVSPKVPMVGLCIYEVQFAYEKGVTLNFEILGSGTNLNQGRIKTITNTHFSPFFQIKGKSDQMSDVESVMSVEEYQTRCDLHYKQKVEKSVNLDISRQIMNFVFHNNPKSTCLPSLDKVESEGDGSCMEWFRTEIHPRVQSNTVPRCVLVTGGIHKCELHAKRAGLACPIYFNSDDTFSDTPVDRQSRLFSTRNPHFPNFPCDQANNLICEIEKYPFFIRNVPLTEAEGRCRPIAPN